MSARTVIDGLTVTGGRHGIAVTGNSTIRNCTVENTGWNGIAFHPGGQGTVDHCTVQWASRNGIVFVPGSFGTVDNCIVQNNPRDGILIDANGPIVINSTITLNTGHGIHVDQGGKAWIGIIGANQYAGNTIS